MPEAMLVHFHAIASGGDAVGRDETGRTVFAPYAAPDESAHVELLEARRSFARARLLRVLTPSPQRATPPCPYFGTCGGCQLQHLDYPAQLAAKTQIVRDALTRLAGLPAPLVEPCVPSPTPLYYRNKADLQVDEAGLGFFERESHRVVDIAHCPIQQTASNNLLRFLRDERSNLPSDFCGATLRVASNGDCLLQIETRETWQKGAKWAEHAIANLPPLQGVTLQQIAPFKLHPLLLAGRDWLEEEVAGLTLRVSGFGFFQVNTALTPALVETVLNFAGHGADTTHGGRALDLFCGVGLFGLHLARNGWRVAGVEASKRAILDAQGNAARLGLSAHFEAGDAAKALARWKGPLDLVVLDPPRRGAAECVAPLLKQRPARVIYVSCDPATLARDVKALGVAYRLQRAVPLDLFPQTAHVETIALLERCN